MAIQVIYYFLMRKQMALFTVGMAPQLAAATTGTQATTSQAMGLALCLLLLTLAQLQGVLHVLYMPDVKVSDECCMNWLSSVKIYLI